MDVSARFSMDNTPFADDEALDRTRLAGGFDQIELRCRSNLFHNVNGGDDDFYLVARKKLCRFGHIIVIDRENRRLVLDLFRDLNTTSAI
jgi:hypothetical protein